ncbi:heme peroxidase [Lentinula raphanica]|nr:heme peroxidase [Lentinula raphanica]
MVRFIRSLYAPTIITVAFADFAHCLSTFKWPNPQLSYADIQIYEGSMGILVQDCAPRDNTTIPAQWLRIAYHDMSTHDVDDGTGGLDSSIQYELDRSQNVGKGMIESLNDFKAFRIATPFFGMADTIALGAIFAVAGCGGPLIPFSAGRIDATEAGPATVPEPQQDLASHTESFRRQGFTPTEMISLVACGHTLGGVRQVDFPLVVTDTEEDVQTFDSTTDFDNRVVSEYLQNTTQNILVMGPNVTTRSDLRIFSSDGNVTMQSLLTADTFSATCQDLIGRMINTVPEGVTLTQPISEPFDYVISEPLFSYRDGSLSMATTLRVINPSNNPSRTASILWTDRQGSSCPSTGCTSPATNSQAVVFSLIGNIQGLTGTRYSFNASINSTTSLSKFWFEIDENDGSAPLVVDNGGSGFIIAQDMVFIDNSRSENVEVSSSFNEYRKLVVAMRGDATSTGSVTAFDPNSAASAPPYVLTVTTTELQLDASNSAEGGFTFFTTNVSETVNFVNLSADVGGTTYTQEYFDMTIVNFPFVTVSG